jgi:hypothetical protein
MVAKKKKKEKKKQQKKKKKKKEKILNCLCSCSRSIWGQTTWSEKEKASQTKDDAKSESTSLPQS